MTTRHDTTTLTTLETTPAPRWRWGRGVGGNLLHAIPAAALEGTPATAACGVPVVAWALLAQHSLPGGRLDDSVDTPLCTTCQHDALATGGLL